MEPFIGQLCVFGFNFAPRGWAICDGSLLPINQNPALFSLLGTMYGGDGRTTFALPDLRGRVPVGMGQGPGLTPVSQGDKGGNETVSLTAAQMPAHNHTVTATATVALACTSTATSTGPSSVVPATTRASVDSNGEAVTVNAYGPSDGNVMAANAAVATVSATCANAGSGQPVAIRNPYLGMNWCIATDGVFPSRQ